MKRLSAERRAGAWCFPVVTEPGHKGPGFRLLHRGALPTVKQCPRNHPQKTRALGAARKSFLVWLPMCAWLRWTSVCGGPGVPLGRGG